MMVKGTEQALSVCLSPQETGCLTFPFRQRRSWALPGAVSSLPGAQPWAECVHEPDSQRQPAVLVPAPAVPPPLAVHITQAPWEGWAVWTWQVRSALSVGFVLSSEAEMKAPGWKGFGELEPAMCLRWPPGSLVIRRAGRMGVRPAGAAQGSRWPAAFAFFGCHQGLAAGPVARHSVDGPPQLRRTCAQPSAP